MPKIPIYLTKFPIFKRPGAPLKVKNFQKNFAHVIFL